MPYTMTSRVSLLNITTRCVGGCVLAALLALSGEGCRRSSAETTPTLTTVQVVAAKDAEKAHDASTEGARYTGGIIANTQVDLYSKQGGYVEEILRVHGEDGRLRLIQQGDVVRQGQTLAHLQPGDFSTRVSQAQAQHWQAQAGLAQAEATLLQAHAGADQAAAGLREALAGVEASVAALANARNAVTLAAKQTDGARIGRRMADAQQKEVRAAFTKAHQDFDRAAALYSSQSLTRSDYDATKAAYDAAGARLEQAQEGIETAANRIVQAEQQERLAHDQVEQAVAQVAVHKSQVRQAQARLDASRGAIRASEAQVATAQAAVSGASAQVRAAEIPLEETSLKAPLDGVLLRRTVEIGSLIGPSAPPAFTLADTSLVKVVVAVPDSQVKGLQLGRRVPVQVDVLGASPLTGRITAISPEADPRTRVFNVEVTIANPLRRLKVGMIATLDLGEKRSQDKGAAVPISAIVRSSDPSGGYAVFVATQDGDHTAAHLRSIRLGAVYGGNVMVQGVRSGERIITEGVNFVRDGQSVQIAGKEMEANNDAQD